MTKTQTISTPMASNIFFFFFVGWILPNSIRTMPFYGIMYIYIYICMVQFRYGFLHHAHKCSSSMPGPSGHRQILCDYIYNKHVPTLSTPPNRKCMQWKLDKHPFMLMHPFNPPLSWRTSLACPLFIYSHDLIFFTNNFKYSIHTSHSYFIGLRW